MVLFYLHKRKEHVYTFQRQRHHPKTIKEREAREALCVHCYDSAAGLQNSVSEGFSSRHGVMCLEGAGQSAAEYPAWRALPLGNSDALVVVLNLCTSQSINLIPLKLMPEVRSNLWHSLLGDSAFTCNIPLQNRHDFALDSAPVNGVSVAVWVLSQPGVLIQISSEISLILLFLRKIITIFRVSFHFLRI